MASLLIIITLISLLITNNNYLSTSKSTSPLFKPKALVIPITKDTSTKTVQYTTLIRLKTPLKPLKLTLDLTGDLLWLNCSADMAYTCNSKLCKLAAQSTAATCLNRKTCTVFPRNPITKKAAAGILTGNYAAFRSTDGFTSGQNVIARNIPFACAPKSLLAGLAIGVSGSAGLGSFRISLPSRIAASYGLSAVFAICLTSSPGSRGVGFFGGGPYHFLLNTEVSDRNLIKTPLVIDRTRPGEYFFGVAAIRVNGRRVRGFNSTALLAAPTGISITERYTAMQSSIYTAVTAAFERSLSGIQRVAAPPPFKLCYPSAALGSTRVGPGVPQIDLVLRNKGAVWRIFGDNSMVSVAGDVMCLGIVDGGQRPRSPIIIGAHQIENNLLQFDLVNRTLSFTSTLLFRQTSCANFNFTGTSF